MTGLAGESVAKQSVLRVLSRKKIKISFMGGIADYMRGIYYSRDIFALLYIVYILDAAP